MKLRKIKFPFRFKCDGCHQIRKMIYATERNKWEFDKVLCEDCALVESI